MHQFYCNNKKVVRKKIKTTIRVGHVGNQYLAYSSNSH